MRSSFFFLSVPFLIFLFVPLFFSITKYERMAQRNDFEEEKREASKTRLLVVAPVDNAYDDETSLGKE